MNVYKQSAVIPFRIENSEIEILLISSLKKQKWIIPKGIIEENMTPWESAKKEAMEEAGVTGKVHPVCLGEYTQKKWGGTCAISVYALEVHKEYTQWEECNIRTRRWFSANKAAMKISNSDLRKILSRFVNNYNSTTSIKV